MLADALRTLQKVFGADHPQTKATATQLAAVSGAAAEGDVGQKGGEIVSAAKKQRMSTP
jgi:hypothetical protein